MLVDYVKKELQNKVYSCTLPFFTESPPPPTLVFIYWKVITLSLIRRESFVFPLNTISELGALQVILDGFYKFEF